MIRELYLTRIYSLLVGPAGGINERLQDITPQSLYVSGALGPETEKPNTETDYLENVTGEDLRGTDEVGEEDYVDSDAVPVYSQNPVLDPKALPKSIGITFSIKSGSGLPDFDVCVTWGRYFLIDRAWVRFSRHYCEEKVVSKSLRAGSEKHKSVMVRELRVRKSELKRNAQAFSQKSEDSDLEAKLVYEIVPCSAASGQNCLTVTIHFVNAMFYSESKEDGSGTGGSKYTEMLLFQPQIRVKLGEGTEAVPFFEAGTDLLDDPEDMMVNFLFRNVKAYARGHMVSAIWKDIDPEAEVREIERSCRAEDPDINAEELKKPPFYWIDGDVVEEELRKKFSPADIRSEFIPLVVISAPSMEWTDEYGNGEPLLDAEQLSEAWDPEVLKRSLQPLVDAAERWTETLKTRISEEKKAGDKWKRVYDEVLETAENTKSRMKKGIEILGSDTMARLAFCFMNRAMSIGYRWSKKQGDNKLVWKPFQLAFILMEIPDIVDPNSKYRDYVDTLWVPTGGGKTEAYTGVILFTLAYRRLKILQNCREADVKRGDPVCYDGTSVMLRYTLRLLTVQQFQRLMNYIEACEYLRVWNLPEGPIGWRPHGYNGTRDFIWGTTPFSAGLWVGQELSPNTLVSSSDESEGAPDMEPGAINILKNEKYDEGEYVEKSTPVHIIRCPACGTWLSFPRSVSNVDMKKGVFWVLRIKKGGDVKYLEDKLSGTLNKQGYSVEIIEYGNPSFITLKVASENTLLLDYDKIKELWDEIDKTLNEDIELASFSWRHPGYFPRTILRSGKNDAIDFDIYCPNPGCDLRKKWIGGMPAGLFNENNESNLKPPSEYDCRKQFNLNLVDGNRFIAVHPAFRASCGYAPSEYVSDRVPITAYTVDEQIYSRLPSVVIATVDKFARLPFNPEAGMIFGRVKYADPEHGFSIKRHRSSMEIEKIEPPWLIVQDELHLIDGPLGSLVGLYEIAIEYLIKEKNVRPKYIAASATLSRVNQLTALLYARRAFIFPPAGFDISDRLFVRENRASIFNEKTPGRVYAGMIAPGKGPLTPIIRMWTTLLQLSHEIETIHGNCQHVDPFWTVVGYFNSVRELAGAWAIYTDDMVEWLKYMAENNYTHAPPRSIAADRRVELSRRVSSATLQQILEIISQGNCTAPDALFSTAMFGTGVDVPRLSLMVMHGQPKTTSSYIQATGRVGRAVGGLVINFYRATRPRDLSHYEYFTSYHLALHKYVEPPSVNPYSERAIEVAGGPVYVAIARNSSSIDLIDNKSATSVKVINRDPSFIKPLEFIEERVKAINGILGTGSLDSDEIRQTFNSLVDRWVSIASSNPDLVFWEGPYASPSKPVVLGDLAHELEKHAVVYRDVPQSLRGIEHMFELKLR